MATPEKVRFSTGVANAKDVPHANFSWEHPVPDNDFWRTIRYPSARNFLQCFTEEEAVSLRLNEKYGSLSQDEKVQILIKILEDRTKDDEVGGKSLSERDNKVWEMRMLTIGGLYSDLGRQDETVKISETLVEHAADKSKISHVHNLAGALVRRGEPGDHARAEELEKPCLASLDEMLGRDSPQSMGGRRILIRAAWMQGHQADAEKLIEEIKENIELMKKGRFEMYVDDERAQLAEEIEDLKKAKPNA